MRIDYKEERVLIFSLVWALGMLVFGWLGSVFSLDIWGGVLGGLLVVIAFARICRWDVWDFLDATMLLGFGFGVLYFAFDFNWVGVCGAILGGIVVFLTHRTYRKWRWYKSGKLGLSGLVGLLYWGIWELGTLFRHVPGWIGAILLVFSIVAIAGRSRVSLRKP